MKNRRYIVDDTPELSTWLELIYFNLREDRESMQEPLTEHEICSLTRLKRNDSLPLGNCEIRRVI